MFTGISVWGNKRTRDPRGALRARAVQKRKGEIGGSLMGHRVLKRTSWAKISVVFFVVFAAIMTVVALHVGQSEALPASPTDESKVPHYFGPWPNWALSPLTLPDATVTINGNGTGATAVATVGAKGAITGITLTNPGNGYTSATVSITGAGTGAGANAVVNPSGAVTSVQVGAAGGGYTNPTITLVGGGGLGTLVQVGNQLIDRANATDPKAANAAPVAVIVPAPLPEGTLTEFLSLNQAATESGATASAGQTFTAYVLRPVAGAPGQYEVIYDSGALTVPALADPAVSEVVRYPVPDIAVHAGDVLAFYGAGVPFDEGPDGSLFSSPSNEPPAQGTTITVDGNSFPVLGETRTYSFAANVVAGSATSVADASNITLVGAPLVAATATAYGGVDSVIISAGNEGLGYTFPTVDFDLPDDPNGTQAKAHATFDAITGAITGVVVDSPGSGYSSAPNVVIRDGTIFSPIAHAVGTFTQAVATTTITIQSIMLDTYGSGYIAAPAVTISDPGGSGGGASATAFVSAGSLAAINLTAAGSAYITPGGIKKFQDGLPQLCDPSVGCTDNNLGQHIPLAVPDTDTFTVASGFGGDADYYVIGLVQHRERMSSSLPVQGTLSREYVQIETPQNASWSKHVPLQNDLLDGTSAPVLINGVQAYAVDDPHYMGPIIQAQKDRAVRIVFYNLLPTGSDGDLFIPVDTTFMGAGMGPMDMMAPMDMGSVLDQVRNPYCGELSRDRTKCFADTRASIHLHGGITPWISDGQPHQWITPANEQTGWPEGVAVSQVPDMMGGNLPPGVPECSADDDGCTTFYYTNQQSARLMFYHDHAWGITRLNVYAGEAAGYIIRDATEQALIDSGLLPTGDNEIPLVIQDRTFVPNTAQMAEQDPTWDYTRWGSEGDLWYEHVYMPAQNPGDPSGMSAYGRWFYGPWFWPPSSPTYGAIDNPYYNKDPLGPDMTRGTADDWSTDLAVPCSADDPSTWQYDVDPYCEPAQIPGTPNNSAGMEQFNDTPIVNGTAYPTTTVQPEAYRLRILNAANDRFWNLQWYVADPTTGTLSEVALNASEVAAAQTDPNIFPTPDTSKSPVGPSWIQIGSEGGFLPAPAVIPNQPITWIIDPTRFDVGNVDQHSLLLGPAERADVIVDFSKYAGKTLILYNDAPAAFPARISTYDYYTGGPDLSPNGAPIVLPGYGPNTRTIMQVKVAASTPAPTYNLTALNNAFKHHADGSGVFESGQNPIIVGQAPYNSAYGTSFISAGWCNSPTNPSAQCDGYARINEQGGDTFNFDTLMGSQIGVKIEPKALHDEMNSTNFEPYGRMSGNIGVEVVPATPATQNVVLYPFVNPPTEIFDATDLPSTDTLTPIAVGDDGTQIWKITHNGVDTHPIHFHLYDVQVLNRVTWDNIIIPPDANELGWKDTVRVSPLEDTYFAIRPVIPTSPWEVSNCVRPLNPMMPLGDTSMFNSTDVNGNPTSAITNQIVNFGWEYMLHCHILSHEEMDMMRPVVVALPPYTPDGVVALPDGGGTSLTFYWNDASITETSFVVQRSTDGTTWEDLTTIDSPLDMANVHGTRVYVDGAYTASYTLYRVIAKNMVGYGGEYPEVTVQSISANAVTGALPAAPTITGLIPTGGPTAGGTTVVIMGTDFAGMIAPDAVTFDGLNATSYVVDSATQITAVSPPHAVGPVQVQVNALGGSSTSGPSSEYTYAVAPAVTGVVPNMGPVAGGTIVTITGTDFVNLTGPTGVTFGGIDATTYTVDSPTQITATAPAYVPGTVQVQVSTLGGASPDTPADDYTYLPLPTVTAVNPNFGPSGGGTIVTITGTNFANMSGPAAVTFGGTNATTYTVDSPTQITATAPAHAGGLVQVQVTTPGGATANTAADDYTYGIIYTSIRGTDRFDTAIRISKAMFPGALPANAGLVLAPGETYQEALCGAPLAAAYGGPVLLTPTIGLNNGVRAEILRLNPSFVICIGLSDTIRNAVQAALPTATVSTIRGTLGNVYDMSRKVANALATKVGGLTAATAIITRGDTFPDATAVSPLASAKKWPILLTGSTITLNLSTTLALNELGITKAIKVGTYATLPLTVTGLANLSGVDRYQTNVKVAEWSKAYAGLTFANLALAPGDKFPDALAAGPFLAQNNGILLLTPAFGPVPSSISAEITANRLAVQRVTFLAVVEPVPTQVKALLP